MRFPSVSISRTLPIIFTAVTRSKSHIPLKLECLQRFIIKYLKWDNCHVVGTAHTKSLRETSRGTRFHSEKFLTCDPELVIAPQTPSQTGDFFHNENVYNFKAKTAIWDAGWNDTQDKETTIRIISLRQWKGKSFAFARAQSEEFDPNWFSFWQQE